MREKIDRDGGSPVALYNSPPVVVFDRLDLAMHTRMKAGRYSADSRDAYFSLILERNDFKPRKKQRDR